MRREIVKNNNGITLIALVITIIILIILAGVSINLVFNEDGLINRAKQAAENMELAQIEEQESLEDYKNKIDKYINENMEESDVEIEDSNEEQCIVKVSSSKNIIKDFKGVTITIKNENEEILQEYVLKENESQHTFNIPDGIKYKIELTDINNDYYVCEISGQDEFYTAKANTNRRVDLEYIEKIVYLYNYGKDNTEVTGGWNFSREHEAGSSTETDSLYTLNSDNIYIKQYGKYASQYLSIYTTNNVIDFSKYSKIKIEYVLDKDTDVVGGSSVSIFDNAKVLEKSLTKTSKEIDITDIDEEKAASIRIRTCGMTDYYVFLTVYKIWLEV